jgi:hypothetical protein
MRMSSHPCRENDASMDKAQFEALKAAARERLAALLETTTDALRELDDVLDPLLSNDDEVQAILQRMDRASAKMPFGLLAYMYSKGMERARGPVVHIDGGLSDEYEEIADDTVAGLKEKFMLPATDAYKRIYPKAQQVLADVQNYALTLRYFSNSEPLLAQYASVLAPPWFEGVTVDDLTPKGGWRLHYYYASLPYRLAPHIEIIAQRRASLNSLNLIRGKLYALRSLLEVSLTELAFSAPRAEPAPVPINWYDHSVKIGDNAMVDSSAIGSDAGVQKRLI